MPLATLGAALGAGLAGSAHCFAMCGGMAGAVGIRAQMAPAALPPAVHATLSQLGRVAGYAMVGAIAGALSQGTQWFLELAKAEALLRVAAGLLTLLIAVRLLWGRNFLAPLERAGQHVWRRLQPHAHRAARNPRWYGSLVLGLLWGWLPCGMVYSVLLLATTTGSPALGAATMACFGLGTLPAMLASSLLVTQMRQLIGGPLLRTASGLLLTGFGLWMLLPHSHMH